MHANTVIGYLDFYVFIEAMAVVGIGKRDSFLDMTSAVWIYLSQEEQDPVFDPLYFRV